MTALIAWSLIGAAWTGAAIWVGITIGRAVKARELQVPAEPDDDEQGEDPEPVVVADKPGPPAHVLHLLARSVSENPPAAEFHANRRAR